jgi:transcription-repair coupling factor (superfamily II helicase)
MSMAKIRDMSVINTPPRERMPVETYVMEFNQEILKMGIENELNRNGQVFFLYNRVKTIYEMAKYLEQLVPQARVVVAHGQMDPEELEDIIHDFIEYKYDILLTTTIIESGIDIPRANTIFIDRADRFGLAQLYQLRGRVGRSNLKAYAYLFYESKRAVSEDAMKKLRVISEYTELGSGFKVAMKDMEIRGAGNLLGRDQSGDVYAVGFDLYVKLLNEAVNRLTMQKDYQEQSDVLMELEYTGFIPETYVQNPQVKMEIYKKIASVITDAEFENVVAELSDRFGPIPDEVSSLLALAEIRIICKKLGIKSIKERQGEVKVEFGSVTTLSIDKILKLIKDNPQTIRLNSALPNVLFIKLGKIGLKEKSEFIREKLIMLA